MVFIIMRVFPFEFLLGLFLYPLGEECFCCWSQVLIHKFMGLLIIPEMDELKLPYCFLILVEMSRWFTSKLRVSRLPVTSLESVCLDFGGGSWK